MPDERTILLDGAHDETVKSSLLLAEGMPEVQALEDYEGKYLVGRMIGSGGNSTVVIAEEKQLGRTLALKILKGHCKHNKKMVLRFLREARIMSNLQHPGILQIYAIGRIGDKEIFYSMPVVKGKTLRELLAFPPLKSIAPQLDHFRRACTTLGYAHAQNIIHRDLKPENIMIDDEHDNLVVMDWGLAKDMAKGSENNNDTDPYDAPIEIPEGENSALLTMHGEISGTPAYMSPEQCSGMQRMVDKSSDVFSLGILLYETLYGDNPFTGQDNNKNYRLIFNDIKHMQPAFASRDRFGKRIEPDLLRICKKCLAKVPHERYHDAHELSVDLRRQKSGRPLKNIGDDFSLSYHTSKFLGRKWKWLTLCGFLILGGITTHSLLLLHSSVSNSRTLTIQRFETLAAAPQISEDQVQEIQSQLDQLRVGLNSLPISNEDAKKVREAMGLILNKSQLGSNSSNNKTIIINLLNKIKEDHN